MFQLRYTNSVYATSDTGELDGTGERVALMLQPRHTCSWVGDIPFRFIDSVQLAGSASTTHLYNDYDAIRDRRGRTTQAGAADVPAPLHRLMDRRGHG